MHSMVVGNLNFFVYSQKCARIQFAGADLYQKIFVLKVSYGKLEHS